MRCGILLHAVVGAMILSSSAPAVIEVIFSEIPGHATALVPPGTGLPVNAEFELFDRPFRSPNGQRFIMQAQVITIPDTEDRIVMVFDGADWATVLREGAQAPWTVAAETIGFFDVDMGINDSGQFAFGNDTSGPTASDLYVVKFDGANYVTIAQEGQPIPAGGGNYGATQGSMHVLANGTVGFDSTASMGGSRIMHGGTVVAQSTVTILANQPLGQTQTFSSLVTSNFFSSADGTSTIFECNLNGDTTVDEVIALNNSVVLHEGMTITGMSAPFGATFGEVRMMSNGDWFVRGSTTDDEDYIVRNGSLLVRSGDPITTSSSELFDDTNFTGTFFWMQGNNGGDGESDYVIGGSTNAANVDADAVLVLNGTTVIAREGDPVDLNGNGQPDDDAFIGAFNNDDGFLTDDAIYFTADLRDADLNALGQGFLRIDLGGGEPCPANIVDTGTSAGRVDVDDLLAVISAWGPCLAPPAPCAANIVNTGTSMNRVDVDDLLAVISAWGLCP